MADVWDKQAAQWQRVGPPLRPSAEDLRQHQLVAQGWAACGRAPRILLLGVTPELALLQWPQPRSLLAVDRCADMISRVWPRRPDCADAVIRADWLELPLADQSRDLVVSDGCFGVIGYPHQHRALLRSIRRVLSSDGRWVFRIFVRPQPAEMATNLYGEAMAGRIGSFHAFKLRLLMALQADTTSGVRTGDVWENWMTHGPRPRDLVAACGWKAEQIETIDAYRGQTTIYSFPTLDELRELASQEGFEELECAWPGYESGDRCPTLVLSRR